MFKSKSLFDYFIVLTVVIVIGIVYIVSENITQKKIVAVKQEKYNIYSQSIKSEIDTLIKNKQELTFSIALSLAQDSRIIEALKTNDISNIDLKAFSKLLRKTTFLENTWFHIVDAKGNSFYRSWVPKRGDSLLKIRMDVVRMIQNPQIMTTISTGKFDMTFKSMVPIYDKGKFIGSFEIITHFNSIAQQLLRQGVHSVVIVDKKYKKQLTKAFSKKFLGEYYIANYNAKQELLKYIQTKGIENFIHSSKKYMIDELKDHFIVVYNIPDIKGKPMASLIAFKPLSSLNMDDIDVIKDSMNRYIIIMILVLLLIGYYLISKKHSNELDDKVKKRTLELEKEKHYIQTILDTNPNIILVTNSFKIVDANARFLEFFKYDSIADFTKDQDCICDFFITLDDKPFCEDKMVEGIPWAEYVAKNKHEHIVQLRFEDELYIFTVNAEYLQNKEDILLVFQNITELKKKDRLLFEQSKLASMGEMIGNIAHQWRQPLSVVSSSATGMKLQKELNMLNDDQFKKYCDLINDNAQFLSKTIDDFRDFIKGNRKKSHFYLKEKFEALLNLIDPSLKSNNIYIELNIEDDLEINGFSNELVQCFMNIFNNSKDALQNKPEDQRFIKIDAFKTQDEVAIYFKDNGDGVSKDIIDKVFEPYFTTKHQKQGTGLGLHMTYTMIVQGMNGDIEVSNQSFTCNNQQCYGAVFKITLPL